MDVPFVPEEGYPDILAEQSDQLSSVHFSFYDPLLADARQRSGDKPLSELIAGLSKLSDVPAYVLINSRVHDPQKYYDSEHLNQAAQRLRALRDQAGITGVIFSDPYYIQALGKADPSIAGELEAVPSINALIDSPQRGFAMLSMLESTPYRMPSKLVLDRNLNRDMARLAETASRIREAYPDIKLHLMANEGCLLHCPYKLAHDAHIAMVNEVYCGDRTFAMNHDFGCVRRFLDTPESFLTSPFIRPEDVDKYAAHVDGIKLCGRNKGIPFLKRTLDAYTRGYYDGNLLDLMDAMGDLAEKVSIPNNSFPVDFLDRITRCDSVCARCGWCNQLADAIIVRQPPRLYQHNP